MSQFTPRSPEYAQPLEYQAAIAAWNLSYYAANSLQRGLLASYPDLLRPPVQPVVVAAPTEKQPAAAVDFDLQRAQAIAEAEVGMSTMLQEPEANQAWATSLQDESEQPVITIESLAEEARREIAAIHNPQGLPS